MRKTGSTGGMIVFDFFDGSPVSLTGLGVTDDGGSGIGIGNVVVLRVSGSTGGTSGADFLIEDDCIPGTMIAAVLLGVIGSEEVGEVIGGTMGGTVDVRRRAIGGGALGAGVDETGRGGTIEKPGMGGGLTDGARIGEEVATGSGTFDPAAAGVDSNGGVGRVRGDGVSGGCGASGSGTRGDGVGAVDEAGKGGIVVRAVSASPEPEFRGKAALSFEIIGRVPVIGNAGGRVRNSIGATSLSWSVLPLTKTLACGLAMITRGGAGTRPEAVGIAPEVVPPIGAPGIGGMFGGVAIGVVAVLDPLPGTRPVSGGALVVEANVALSGEVFEPGLAVTGGAASRCEAGVGSTSGSVFAREPVSEADCLIWDGAGPTRPVGGRVGFCIGWVTAVDHVGGFGPPVTGCGVMRSEPFSGIVAAVPGTARDS